MKRRIGLLVFPGFQILDLVITTVFELANQVSGRPCYELTMLSEQGGQVHSSSGVPVGTEAFGRHDYDTLMVAGSMELMKSSPAFVQFLRGASAASRRTASICTGRFSWPRRVFSMAAE